MAILQPARHTRLTSSPPNEIATRKKDVCVWGGGGGGGALNEGKKRVENRWRKEGNDMIAIKWNEKANGLDGIFSYSARLYDHIFLGYGSIRRLSSSLIRQSNAKCNFI